MQRRYLPVTERSDLARVLLMAEAECAGLWRDICATRDHPTGSERNCRLPGMKEL